MRIVFNDKESRSRFLDEMPAKLDESVESSGDRELEIKAEKLGELLAVDTEENYLVEDDE